VSSSPEPPRFMTTRCDLHVHSSASTGNDEWYSRFFGCPESYASPARQYELCKARGMSLVTLTDHDTLAGGLTLVDRPDFFLSEEITTVFPENGCVMHVLAWNINERQHEKIQAVRGNIYDLCDYLNREEIAHGLAHPLLSPNWRLDSDLFEKAILLFPTFEGINGLVDRRIEPDLFVILDRLTPDVIASLSRKHGIVPNGCSPSRKALVAGSDDHVHRRSGTIYSEVDGQLTPRSFLEHCTAGGARLSGEQAHLNAMAVCVKHTTYHHLKQRCTEREDFRNPFVEMMDVIAGRESRTATDRPGEPLQGFVVSLLAGLHGAEIDAGKRLDILEIPDRPTDKDDAHIIHGIAQVSNKVIERALSDLLDGLNDFDLYRMFGSFRDLAGALVTAMPVFFAAHHFGRQERQVSSLRDSWTAFEIPKPADRLAVFSDSLDQVDGVSTWCTRFAGRALEARQEVLIPHCGPRPGSTQERPLHQLPAITSFAFPLYDQLRFYVPSLIDTLVWAWRERITHVELATPGPMGLVGLLVAKVLQLPVTASYHTEVPALINLLGGHPLLDRVGQRYVGWFYNQVDRVFAFSSRSRDALCQMGVQRDSIHFVLQAVDPREFSPSHRSNSIFGQLNVDAKDRPVILSVGRLSHEKNLPLIIEAVQLLQKRHKPPLLVVVGDGPGGRDLKELHGSTEFVHFVGIQRGQVLKSLYASASMFVFASRVDTLGLVNMEAMSSGIPVLVPADACFAEFVIKGISAECYEFGTPGLVSAMERVLDDPLHALRIGTEGRRVMIERWEGASFSSIWKSMVGCP
jgi:glycosyltransferase involved in cell wall biosynthesis